jgi:hypothetical protein
MHLPNRGLPEIARLPKRAWCDYHRNMPQLKNIKHETFCQLIATSPKTKMSQGQCYEQAGFRTNGRSADACAARLLTQANIRSRIAEITAPAVRKAKLTASSLMEKFEKIETGAVASEQYGAAARAAELQGKLSGLMIDRIEHGGAGEFANIDTVEGVMAALLADQSPQEALATLAMMTALLERQAADHAMTINVPLAPIARDETALSLAALRPTWKNARRN